MFYLLKFRKGLAEEFAIIHCASSNVTQRVFREARLRRLCCLCVIIESKAKYFLLKMALTEICSAALQHFLNSANHCTGKVLKKVLLGLMLRLVEKEQGVLSQKVRRILLTGLPIISTDFMYTCTLEHRCQSSCNVLESLS